MMDDMDEPEVTRGASPKPSPDDEEILNADNKPGSDQIITALSEKMDSCKSDLNSTSSPTNDDAAESGDAPSTSTSSPSSTPGAHQPLFHVRFTDQITRHGQSVSYRIEVTKNTPPYSCHYICREYDDLVYLEQCLATTCGTDGLIVPPLPTRPSLDPHQLQQQQPAEELLLGDDWQRDCRHMEKYLQILCDHPVYGADAQLQRFLVGPDPPVRALHKPSLLSRLSRGLLQPSHATHPDCSEYFQRHRVWISHYQPALQQMADSFTTVVSAQQRLSSQLNHLATAFNIGVGCNEGVSGVYQRLNSRFSDAMQECMRSVELSATSSDGTLGLPLELHARYAAAEVDMLQRRTALLVDYEASLRALEKVKPNRYRMAEDSMQKAKLAFEKCSELAKNEILSLRRLRSDELLCGIRELARSQIHSNQILQVELNKHAARLRQFPLSSPRSVYDGYTSITN